MVPFIALGPGGDGILTAFGSDGDGFVPFMPIGDGGIGLPDAA